jgi:hypothetical protein
MEVTLTSKNSQWVMYHLQHIGIQGRVIDTIEDAEPPAPWAVPTTYIMAGKPKYLPPWGSLWVCNQEGDTLNSYPACGRWLTEQPHYTKEVLRPLERVMDRELCAWLLAKYEDYPRAMERLVLRLRVLAMRLGRPLSMGDVLPLVPTIDTTPFLWKYQKVIGKPQGLTHIYGASNSDLWGAFMLDGGLMKYLKVKHPQHVYSLLGVQHEVSGGAALEPNAILWHLETMK